MCFSWGGCWHRSIGINPSAQIRTSPSPLPHRINADVPGEGSEGRACGERCPLFFPPPARPPTRAQRQLRLDIQSDLEGGDVFGWVAGRGGFTPRRQPMLRMCFRKHVFFPSFLLLSSKHGGRGSGGGGGHGIRGRGGSHKGERASVRTRVLKHAHFNVGP